MDDQTNNQNISIFLTAISSVLLVLVGVVQIFVLFSQRKQTRIALTEQYRQLWNSLNKYWGIVVFIGRKNEEYYQILNKKSINNLIERTINGDPEKPSTWALVSIQKVCCTLSEISTRVLQGHLKIVDIYPIFGTQFLRQNRPLRQLLEPEYQNYFETKETSEEHLRLRTEIQDWLVYHEGLRRRCLIIIDLLWAEAARLEDLPPDEMKSGADAKKNSGKFNRDRVFKETIRLNGFIGILKALKLSGFLRRAEYYSFSNWRGIKKTKLAMLEKEMTKRLLRDKFN